MSANQKKYVHVYLFKIKYKLLLEADFIQTSRKAVDSSVRKDG